MNETKRKNEFSHFNIFSGLSSSFFYVRHFIQLLFYIRSFSREMLRLPSQFGSLSVFSFSSSHQGNISRGPIVANCSRSTKFFFHHDVVTSETFSISGRARPFRKRPVICHLRLTVLSSYSPFL